MTRRSLQRGSTSDAHGRRHGSRRHALCRDKGMGRAGGRVSCPPACHLTAPSRGGGPNVQHASDISKGMACGPSMRLGCDAVRIMLHGVCAFCLSQRGAVLWRFWASRESAFAFVPRCHFLRLQEKLASNMRGANLPAFLEASRKAEGAFAPDRSGPKICSFVSR